MSVAINIDERRIWLDPAVSFRENYFQLKELWCLSRMELLRYPFPVIAIEGPGPDIELHPQSEFWRIEPPLPSDG